MYCMHCGASNSDTAKFCRSCGKSLTEESLPPVDAGEETIPLEDDSGNGADGFEERSSDQEQIYDGQPYAEQPYGNSTHEGRPQGQSYGNGGYAEPQPYGNQSSYGNQQPYGGQPYGNQQPYGGQPYGNQPYGDRQPYGNPSSYGGGYGNGQPYGNQPSYGQPGYGQDAYGYQQPYGAMEGRKQKKKGKKGVVIAVVVVLLAALLGGGAFLYIRESNPMAPVEHFFDGIKDGDWDKVYNSIYWGEEGSSGWMSKEEFVREAKSSMGEISYMSGILDSLKLKKISEEPYADGEDGEARKKITVEMSMEFMGMNESQEMDLVVVKSGTKFLFIPVWKIDNQEMDELF